MSRNIRSAASGKTASEKTSGDEGGANSTPPDQDGDSSNAESRMRRALGLAPASGSGATRHLDGPTVTHTNRRRPEPTGNRLAEAEAALAVERQAREQAERLLRDAEAALREAQTRRGHAEVARDEAMQALEEEREARSRAEAQLRELTAPPAPAQPAAPPARRGRPPSRPQATASEGGAVEWWLPGWKARTGR